MINSVANYYLMMKHKSHDWIKYIVSEDSRKTFLIFTFGTIGAITSLFFSIDGYYQNRSIFYLISVVLLFSITTVNLIYFSFTRNTGLASNVLVISFFIFCVVFFAFTGIDYSAIVWCFVFSPLAILLTNIRKGLIYNMLLYIAVILIIKNPFGLNVNTYPDTLALRFLIAYPTVNVFTMVFEYTRNHAFQAYMDTLQKVKHKNDDLLVAKNELTKLVQTKDKFFSIIAHDLRSPFNSIMALTGMLSEDNQMRENERKEIVNHITKSSKAAKNLLDNLFTWARSQSGQVEYSPQKIGLKTIVEDVFQLAQVTAKGKGIRLINNVEIHNLVFVDLNMIQTVIRNLVFNAIKFTNNDGEITISTILSDEKGFVKVAVTDTGIGMDQTQLEKLFRLDINTSTPGTDDEKGTGLGLIICKEFISKHQGEIYVESHIGKGSSFVFSIPTA